MNQSKWVLDLAAPVRPLEEVLASYAELLRRHERLLRRLDAICGRQRQLSVAEGRS